MLDGHPAPPQLGTDLEALLRLPAPVRQGLWDVIEPLLPMPRDDRVLTRLKRAARDLEVETELLSATVKACIFLLTFAAQHDVGRAAFLGDLRALVSESAFAAVQELVLPLYERGFPVLRELCAMRSVAEHGRVVQQIGWRLEVVKASHHARGLSVPVTSLSFDYLEGQTGQRITLQLMPEQLVALRRICDDVLDEEA